MANSATEKPTNKKTRLLGKVVAELESKVIKAAQNLEQQLAHSAEQPASSSAEQAAGVTSMDTADAADPHKNLKIFSAEQSDSDNLRPLNINGHKWSRISVGV